jgi:hypothetical protein
MMLPRIFVHIPSYRDRECQWTVRDLFLKARHPERVFAGICWQTAPGLDADCFQVEGRPGHVRTVHYDIGQAQGLGWARQEAQNLWKGEEYSLQIDSHMRFVPDWDETMLDMLAECRSESAVLTVYPPGYVPPDELAEKERVALQYIKGFRPDGLLEFGAHILREGDATNGPMPTAAVAGGFIFGPSRILQDVPSDPEMYFSAEETNLAVRLWTAGFDLFSPSRTLLYHYYERKDSIRPWNDSRNWSDREKRTLRRMRALCVPSQSPPAEVEKLGRYGLGSRRSLAEYEDFSGVNFSGRTIAGFAGVYPFLRQSTQVATLPGEDLIQSAGVRFFPVGEEGVLFREDVGEFYRINTAAGLVWCSREEGYSWSRIAEEQAAWRKLPVHVVVGELSTLADHWLGQGLVHRSGERPKFTAKVRRHGPCWDPDFFDFRLRTYELLGMPVTIRYADPDLERWTHPVFAHLETAVSERPACTFTIARILNYVYLFRGDELIHHGNNPAALTPVLKFQVLSQTVGLQDALLQIHAGAVECDGCLVLMPGQSGDGKTLPTARLVAAGALYFSDEVVLLERRRAKVRPVPIGLCVKSSGLDLLAPYFPGLRELPEHDREDGLRVRYLAPPPGRLPNPHYSAVPAIVIFRRYIDGSEQTVRELTSLDGFGRLMDHCVAVPKPLAKRDASELIGMIGRVKFYELTGSDLDRDAATVFAICRAAAAPEAANVRKTTA